ncbi:MAG: SdiA-regulated domain-containing protein [Bacteroidota bacterium]
MRAGTQLYMYGLSLSFCCLVLRPTVVNTTSALSWYDLEDKKPSRVDLGRKLREISGLAMTEDGRLFAHNDERGVIYQVDYLTGKVVKSFSLGRIGIRADFEGLAIVGDRFFLVSSWGNLYEFSEGKDGGYVAYKMHRTALTFAHDVEGLCYDPDTHSLLLACKEYPGKGYGKSKAVYAFSLETMKLEKKPRFLLPLRELRRKSRHKLFNPSGIERHPKTGTFFILAAQGESLVEVSPTGELLGQVAFRRGVHKQAEGITFAPDFTLLISDEGVRRQAKLTRYPVKK